VEVKQESAAFLNHVWRPSARFRRRGFAAPSSGRKNQNTFAALFFETKRPPALPLDGLN
jgi:hypothetical protein